MKNSKIILIILLAIISFGVLCASEQDPKELARDWEALITKMIIEKHKVTVNVNGKEYKVLDIKAQNSILIMTVDKKEKIALSLPFQTKDRDGNTSDLFFTFEK